jgi:hypothetical protein
MRRKKEGRRDWRESPQVERRDGSIAHGCCVVACPFEGPPPVGYLGSHHPVGDYAHWMCYPHWLQYIGHPVAAYWKLLPYEVASMVRQLPLWGGA